MQGHFNQFEKLEDNRRQLQSMLSGYRSQILNKPPKPGKWSPMQILEHILLAENGTLGMMRKRMEKNPVYGDRNVRSSILLWFAKLRFWLRIPLDAPRFVSMVPETSDPADLFARWQACREQWREFLSQFPSHYTTKTVFKHPILGLLTLSQTLDFMDAHLNVHSKQIKEALQNTSSRQF